MKIPNYILASGHKVNIRRHSNQDNEKPGFYNSWFSTINITNDNELPESGEAEILMHEIIEMTNAEYDMKLPHQTISTLSQQLFAVIRNNKLDFTNEEK